MADSSFLQDTRNTFIVDHACVSLNPLALELGVLLPFGLAMEICFLHNSAIKGVMNLAILFRFL